jgi:hypothetical protein
MEPASLKPTVAAPLRSPCTPRPEEMTDYPEQNAVGTGIAQAFGECAHATVNITGFTSEQIAGGGEP